MDKENNKTSKKKSEPSQQEIQKISKEIAKRLTAMPNIRKVGVPKKRMFGGVNPFILLIISILSIFLFFGNLGSSNVNSGKVSLTELIQGINENKYSNVTIQNDGTVTAKDKTHVLVDVSDESIDKIQNEQEGEINDKDKFKEVSISEVSHLFEKQNIVSQIRNLFNRNKVSLKEIIYIEENTILITSGEESNYVIALDKNAFREALIDAGLKIENVSVTQTDLFYDSYSLNQESFMQRVDQKYFEYFISLDGLIIAKVLPANVQTKSLDWTPNIFSFADFLSTTGIDLSDPSLTFQANTKNIAPSLFTLDTILTILTIAGFVFIGFVIFRSAQSSGMGVMQFGQSKAKMFFGQKTGVTFKDVAGIDEAREELNEIVEFLKYPDKYRKLGARIPKGVLMFGSPGTGKTLLARAIAGEAGVPFFHTSGSEFEEMLVGAGASRVRDLFAKAKKAAPSLIFIDEIDAVARKRGTRIQSGSSEQTLNQILVEMDGFEKNTSVIVIAATNRPDVLDKAILRPGRFDRQVAIELPDKDGRLQILQIHAKNKPLEADVDLERVARRTVGSSGADLENILNESAILAAKQGRKAISNDDIYESISKTLIGPAKKSRKRTEDELKLVAYHEAGHAVVAKYTPNATPVDKISIISRGGTGGVTMFLPDKDENIVSKGKLIADIIVSLGGRAAEEIALNDISTGASNDIKSATRIARQIVQKYGMNEKLGLINYGAEDGGVGYSYGESKEYSDKTAEMIDEEVRKIVTDAYETALKILTDNRDKLEEVTNQLLEKEVIDRDDFYKIFE